MFDSFKEFDFYHNDSSVVLTQPKVASRVCDHWYSLTCNKSIVEVHPNTIATDDTNITHIINDICNAAGSERDIYLLYRNPSARWLSGIYQEFMSFMEDSENSNLFYVSRCFEESDYVYNFLTCDKTNWRWKNIPHTFDFTDYQKDIIKKIVHYFAQEVDLRDKYISLSHTQNYLVQLYGLVTSNTIDKNKIKLVNIDNHNLETIFKKFIKNVSPLKKDHSIKNK